MTIIKILIIFCIVTFFINFLSIRSNFKIFLNLIINLIVISYQSINLDQLVLNLFVYTCFLYIILNIYTTRYSSIRIKIMESIKLKKKYSELMLFKDREKRFKKNIKNKDTIMQPVLFNLLSNFVKIFKLILL